MVVREKDAFSEVRVNGCRVDCFDRVAVVHIDKAREPTWTADYVLVIPWEKVEHLTLLPRPPAE
jgi:hypothetical protein